jgi:acyl-CoA synthetase (AMP-forming)/AMP-acid ligase II
MADGHGLTPGRRRRRPAARFVSRRPGRPVGLPVRYGRSGTAGPLARSFTGGELTVLADADSPVVPGSGQIGRVAYAGRLPVGYYKDEAKSAATFRTVRGPRYVITGDFATVQADGQVIVLGRGSSCINTGGEKVYPEEVEEVLKRHPSVADAAVLGLPDERFGETVVAAVQLAGGWDLDDEALRAHVRGRLAGYKVPRQVVAVPEVTRGPTARSISPEYAPSWPSPPPRLTPTGDIHDQANPFSGKR